MTESKEHSSCKKDAAFITGGKMEIRLPSGEIADIITRKGKRLEVDCKRNSKKIMQCVVRLPNKKKVDCKEISKVARLVKKYGLI